MQQIMGSQMITMRSAIGESLASYYQIIGIIKHVNGNRFSGDAV
jgi:hypothetical protein